MKHFKDMTKSEVEGVVVDVINGLQQGGTKECGRICEQAYFRI